MPRAIRLPPLIREYEMPSNGIQSLINENVDPTNGYGRRQSVLSSSDAKTDSQPIDCVLVYSIHENEHKIKNNHPGMMGPSEQRKSFENYIQEKQGLILQPFIREGERTGYVKVHSPFRVLLSTAENMRMRLPIEKIDENPNDDSQAVESCWDQFIHRFKKPFYLDRSLSKGDPDYYTAIYSSNIEKFEDLFDKLRGTRENYFTAGERSLLTHELLSRAHFVDDDDDQQKPVELVPAIGLPTGSRPPDSRRPGIDRLIAKKVYVRYFPLHESLRDEVTNVDDEVLNDREKLKKHWATMRRCLKFQPLSLIRSYMGEKVTFYFAFLGFYNQMLIPAALVGVIIFIYGAASVSSDQPTSDICGDYGQSTNMCPRCDKTCPFWKLSDSCIYSKISYVFDNTATVVFGILMSLWARWFIEFWKRRQAVLQYEWDSMDFEGRLEPIRPEFENKAKKIGEQRINPVTEVKEPYVSNQKRFSYFLIAAAVVIIAIIIVCGTIFSIIVYRVQMNYILQNTSAKEYSSIIITVTSAVMNLICSLVLSQLYYWMARRLTDLELHKYQSKYDDSFTIKIYLFQFVNFYSSLFYIAFFKGRFLGYPSKYGQSNTANFTEQCDPAGCIVELTIQLIIIMIGNQFINNIIDFCAAMGRTCARVCCRSKNDHEEQWEIDNHLYDFDSNILMDEYLELVIQFGFVTLFVVAFPLAPLFALINNLIEIRLDAWKFLSKYKRPIPYKASDIGIWGDIISGISYLAVLTNAIVIAWTSEFIPKMAYRSLQSTGTSLNGYVNWTLSSFSIADYNQTGLMPPGVPDGLTYCRYRDFRSSTNPYSETSIYWNVLAARLAFIIIFEHVTFFIIYLIDWLVPDVPKKIQNKIDHERFIDQRERWASGTTEKNFKHAAIASEAISKMAKHANKNIKSPTKSNGKSPTKSNGKSPTQKSNRRAEFRVRISTEDKK